MSESAPAPVPNSAPVAPAAKWNVLSIVSLVASVVGFGLVGVITGHIALSQIKKTGEQGNILAIIGLILGYIGIVVAIILIIVYIGIFAAAASYSSY